MRIATKQQLKEFLKALTPKQRAQVEEQLDGVTLGAGPSKYRNVKTECDGIMFDSAREAKWYRAYKTLERVGRIRDLRLQVPYDLHVNDQVVCRYVADFVYTDTETGERVVVDAKGFRTAIYKRSKRMMKAEYGIVIKEV